MPVYQKFISMDDMFHHQPYAPIVVNDLEMITEAGFEQVQTLLITKLKSDSFSVAPKCQCGHTEGNWLVGKTCSVCGTVVTRIEDTLQPLVWIRSPADIIGLINPHFLLMIGNLLTTSAKRTTGESRKFNVLKWLIDTGYSPSNIIRPPVIDTFIDAGLKRGYNYFVENLDKYLEIAMNHPSYKNNKGKKIKILLETFLQHRQVLVSQYLPIPHKQFVITEKTSVGNYVDTSTVKLLNSVQTMVGIDRDESLHSKKKENMVARALLTLSDYFQHYYKDVWSSKPGHFRKHIYGMRMHFAFRAVISSLTSPHRYDEMHLPWSIGLTALRPMIINKLVSKGYTHQQAVKLIYSRIDTYDVVLDEAMSAIIAESKHGGLPAIIQRNPSLERGSAQRMIITKVKPDPRDKTISFSILAVSAPNADFDGDEMNVLLALDDTVADLWYTLAPHYNVVAPSKYRSLTGNMAIPKPVIATISNWIYRKDTIQFDPKKYRAMEELLA